LSEQEKASLKLQFSDLTVEERLSLKGSRGARGQRGGQGSNGENGKDGERGPQGLRGIPGPIGPRGLSIAGRDGIDGADGIDAPYVVDIRIEEIKSGEIEFVFDFSDGTTITTNAVRLPRTNVYNSVGGNNLSNKDTCGDSIAHALIFG